MTIEPKSPQHVVLIDYENQPVLDGSLFTKLDCIIRVFFGPTHRAVSADLVTALQPLGSSVEYIRSVVTGNNAVDFLLTFHLGQLSRTYPEAAFWIISKDRDFESVPKNLNALGIRCGQVTAVGAIAAAGQANHEDTDVLKVMRYLQSPKTKKPRTPARLRSSIKDLIRAADEQRIQRVELELKRLSIVNEQSGKLNYS